MKTMKLSVYIIFTLTTSSLMLGMPTVITAITDPMFRVEQVEKLAKLTMQVQQAVQLVQQGKTILDYAGDPKAAVRSMSDLLYISQSLERIMGPEAANAIDMKNLQGLLRDGISLEQSANSMMNQGDVAAYGIRRKSTPSLYEALWAAEQMANTVRTEYHKHEDIQRQIHNQMKDAYARMRVASTDRERFLIQAEIDMLAERHRLSEAKMAQLRQKLNDELDEEARRREAAEKKALDQSQFEEAVLNQKMASDREKTRAAMDMEINTRVSTQDLKYNFDNAPSMLNYLNGASSDSSQ
jgi:hypothetical protein